MTITTPGMIDLYTTPDGLVGIDACLPEPLAYAMIDEAYNHKPSGLFVVQHEVGGSMLVDITVSVSAVPTVLASAVSAGVVVRDDEGVALIWHRPVPR